MIMTSKTSILNLALYTGVVGWSKKACVIQQGNTILFSFEDRLSRENFQSITKMKEKNLQPLN